MPTSKAPISAAKIAVTTQQANRDLDRNPAKFQPGEVVNGARIIELAKAHSSRRRLDRYRFEWLCCGQVAELLQDGLTNSVQAKHKMCWDCLQKAGLMNPEAEYHVRRRQKEKDATLEKAKEPILFWETPVPELGINSPMHYQTAPSCES